MNKINKIFITQLFLALLFLSCETKDDLQSDVFTEIEEGRIKESFNQMMNSLKDKNPALYEEFLSNKKEIPISKLKEITSDWQLNKKKYDSVFNLKNNSLSIGINKAKTSKFTMASDKEKRSSRLVHSFVGEQIYDIAIIGDTEINMRGNTFEKLYDYANRASSFHLKRKEHKRSNFSASEIAQNHHLISQPDIVFLAGDLVGDRNWDHSELKKILNCFESKNTMVAVGTGNHDWEPYRWSSAHNGWGWSLTGTYNAMHQTELVKSYANKFMNNPYYWVFWGDGGQKGSTKVEPYNYMFLYKGIVYGVLNNFIGELGAQTSWQSLSSSGPAWFHRSVTDQHFYHVMNNNMIAQKKIFVQHYPLSSSNNWWDTKRSYSQGAANKKYFSDALQDENATLFSAHYHVTYQKKYGNLMDYTAGTFSNGDIMFVKVSSTRGVLAVTNINLGDRNNIKFHHMK